MTEKQILELTDIWMKRFGLDKHDITIKFSDSEDAEAYAEASPSRNYERGDLTFFRSKLKKLSDRDIHSTIIHELIHFLHKEVEDVFVLVEPHLHKDAFAVFDKVADDVCERFVDKLAYILLDLSSS